MKNKEQGFTLVEVIVVIAILGVLSTIVGVGVPAYQSFADKAKLKIETRSILQSMLKARTDAIMDGEERRIHIFQDTGRIYIKKKYDTLYPAEKIELSDGITMSSTTYFSEALDLKPIGTVSKGGHITFKSNRNKYMTIVVQIGSGRIYMKEGMY